MNTSTSNRNEHLRVEMEVNASLQKVIAIYHILQVIAIIICVGLSISYLLFYILLSAIIPISLFIIFWVASRCNFRDLVVILVHFNPILSTMWFISIFPVFILACAMNRQLYMYDYYVLYTVDVRVTIIAVITGVLSLCSAIFAVMGIWKSARNVVLTARSGASNPVNAAVSVPSPYEAPVTFPDLNSIQLAQGPYGQQRLTPGYLQP
ncbi:hypothetical protein ACJMK2_028399 [Sinanodonta woodiana]|uniref:Uncharacterized protein n=1 Tax=Sinanodonta woodiana TaxID=1069815 RepID=A0ABD3X980_SINWO